DSPEPLDRPMSVLPPAAAYRVTQVPTSGQSPVGGPAIALSTHPAACGYASARSPSPTISRALRLAALGSYRKRPARARRRSAPLRVDQDPAAAGSPVRQWSISEHRSFRAQPLEADTAGCAQHRSIAKPRDGDAHIPVAPVRGVALRDRRADVRSARSEN